MNADAGQKDRYYVCRFVRLLDDVVTPTSLQETHDGLLDLARRNRKYRHLFNSDSRGLSQPWLEDYPIAIDAGFLGFDTRLNQLDIYGSYDGRVHPELLISRLMNPRRAYTKTLFKSVFNPYCIRAIT